MNNIYQRLIKVKQAVPYLRKDVTIKLKSGGSYKAMSHDAVSSAVRKALNDNGVLPIPTVIHSEEEKNGNMYKASVTVAVRFVNADDPNECVICEMPGSGLDNGDKAYGKAVSIATKNVYLKVLQIETGENDESRVEPEPEPAPKVELVKPAMAAVWETRLGRIGIDLDAFISRVNKNLNSNLKELTEVPQDQTMKVERFVQITEQKASEKRIADENRNKESTQ